MSYLITRSVLNMKVDIITPVSVNANDSWEFTGPTTYNTDISIVNNDEIQLNQGSSYYIEASPIFRRTSDYSTTGYVTYSLYNTDTSSYIGNAVEQTTNPINAGVRGRACARALVLSSDISPKASITIKLVRVSLTPSLFWNFSVGTATTGRNGYPSVRIIQIPD